MALRLQVLQLSLALAPLRIDSQYLVDPSLVSSGARRQAPTDEIWLLANETDIEHGPQCSTCVPLASDSNHKPEACATLARVDTFARGKIGRAQRRARPGRAR